MQHRQVIILHGVTGVLDEQYPGPQSRLSVLICGTLVSLRNRRQVILDLGLTQDGKARVGSAHDAHLHAKSAGSRSPPARARTDER